jgi:hypothetical protein
MRSSFLCGTFYDRISLTSDVGAVKKYLDKVHGASRYIHKITVAPTGAAASESSVHWKTVAGAVDMRGWSSPAQKGALPQTLRCQSCDFCKIARVGNNPSGSANC